MTRSGYFGLVLVLAAWVAATAVAYFALYDLSRVPRALAVGVSMAGAMFANDFVAFESLFPNVKRVWMVSGILRGVSALVGGGTIAYLTLRSGHAFDSAIAWAMVGGFLLGGTVGTIFRERRSAARERRTG